MRRLNFLTLLVLAIISASSFNANAQTMAGRSYYNPIHIPQVTTQYVTDRAVPNNGYFTGTLFYYDGVFDRAQGGIKYINGDAVYGSFNQYFGVNDGVSFLYIPASNDVAYQRVIRNGQVYNTNSWNIQGRPYSVINGTINFLDTNAGAGSPSFGNSYGGTTNNSSSNASNASNYNRHEATCAGCNGTGRCHHCKGTGLILNNTAKCSLCHGTGTCQACAGVGKKYGNF